jgi:hypothetical protein
MEFHLEQGKEILGRTPSTLDALLRHVSDPWIVNNEGPETWSPYDVVGHPFASFRSVTVNVQP